MPLYIFRNRETEETFQQRMSIAEMEQYVQDNPHLHTVPQAPGLHSGRGLGGGLKISDGFNDRLKEIKKAHWKSNIETK